MEFTAKEKEEEEKERETEDIFAHVCIHVLQDPRDQERDLSRTEASPHWLHKVSLLS
jgi:hypothetical protein